MSKVRIPEDYKEGFKQFSALSDAQRQQLVKIFSQIPAKTPHESMAEQIATELSIEEPAAFEIAQSLDSLFLAKENGRLKANDLIDGVIESLEDPEYNISSESQTSIKESIHALFAKGSNYYLTNKAQALTVQREQLLLKSRILTDIRLVFSEDEDCQIEGEIILHTLKIEYQKGTDNKSIFIALDISDLNELKLQIERAQKKDASIRKNIGSLPNSIIDSF